MLDDSNVEILDLAFRSVMTYIPALSEQSGVSDFTKAFLQGLKPEELSSLQELQLARSIVAQWLTKNYIDDDTHFAVNVFVEGELSAAATRQGKSIFVSPPAVSILTPDSQYLVDTFVEFVHHYGLETNLVLHPLVDASMIGLDVTYGQYSSLYIELEDDITYVQRDEIVAGIKGSYLDLLAYQRDRAALESGLRERLAAASISSTPSNVLEDYGLTSFRVTGGYTLGADSSVMLLSGTAERHPELAVPLASAVRHAFLESRGIRASMCVITADSSIIKAEPLRAISVALPDGTESVYYGVFSDDIPGRSAWDAIGLRSKLEEVLKLSGFSSNSYSYRSLRSLLASFGPDELINVSSERLWDLCVTALSVGELPKLRVHQTPGSRQGIAHVWIFMPADRFVNGLEASIETELIAAYGADRSYLKSSKIQGRRYQIGFVISGGVNVITEEELSKLEESLELLTIPWTEKLRLLILSEMGREGGLVLHHQYRNTFQPDYQEQFTPDQALSDLLCIERLQSEQRSWDIEISRSHNNWRGSDFSLRIFKVGGWVNLSEIVPKLENFGFEVIDEVPHALDIHGTSTWLVTIGVKAKYALGPGQMESESDLERLRVSLLRVFEGQAVDDAINTTVLRAGLDIDQAALIRAYVHYVRFSTPAVGVRNNYWAMVECPGAAAALYGLFAARFGLGRSVSERAEAVGEAHLRVENELAHIDSLDFDRSVRRIASAIYATLRTNFFQADRVGIAIKFDPVQVGDLPKPLPMFETFFDSLETEAIHLRGGRIARGGIRFSDRPDDYRTEILGLMKAQSVKNSVIVPVGAKGGFIVRKMPRERSEILAKAKVCYSEFMEALLSITDNLVAGQVIKPKDTICYDGDDYYLVVAADKGTATFSDIANNIAISRGFWLGDAFASGGSSGYDHKAMGITAKGAWRSVRHHFGAIGIDPNVDQIDVVGVGDMSGDVFGNGMLLSDTLRVIAAFDHRHIFVDPNPDPKISFAERQRLYNLDSSSWMDYDKSLISEGGGVFDRSQKSIVVTEQMGKALGITPGQMEPARLMTSILCAPVDLLWNGGIGTFVKSDSESDLDVSDKANDAIRINADQLKVKVVGEGGNLGMTQLARIEYCLAGGRCNTDAIDNSAGVDTSDHEVNLKILMAPMVLSGEFDTDERDALLAGAEPEVAEQVLSDNVWQNWALSVAEEDAKARPELYRSLISFLEEEAGLDPVVEFVPSQAELEVRNAQGGSLTRPELSVLLAYSKIHLYHLILESDLVNSDLATTLCRDYFPSVVEGKFGDRVLEHSLHHEIAATALANLIVNVSGMVPVVELLQSTPVGTTRIVEALAGSIDVLGAQERAAALFLGSTMAQADKVALHSRLGRTCTSIARWLASQSQLLDGISERRSLSALGNDLVESLDVVLTGSELAGYRQSLGQLISIGADEQTARFFAGLDFMSALVPLSLLANRTHTEVSRPLIWTFYRVGEVSGISPLFGMVRSLKPTGRWDMALLASIATDFYMTIVAKCEDVLDLIPSDVTDEAATAASLEQIEQRLGSTTAQVLSLVSLLGSDSSAGLSALAVVAKDISINR